MKKTLSLLPVLYFGIQSALLAQPTIVWEKSFGGTYTDVGRDIISSEDGNYLALCRPYSKDGDVLNNHGSTDYWLLKLDQSGQIIWQKTYGGSDEDDAARIIPASDGGYMLFGSTLSKNGDVSANHGGNDFWLVKINPAGDILWQKTYGGSKNDRGKSIIPTDDGGYMLIGDADSDDFEVPNNHHGETDLWLIKITANGDIIWSKLYGGNYGDEGNCIIPTLDGGYIIAGTSTSTNGDAAGNHGSTDSWILKIDSIGTKQWKRVQGGTDTEFCRSIVITDDGGYLVLNSTASVTGAFSANHGSFDIWLYKLSSTGVFEWQKFYGGSNSDGANELIKLSNGKYLLLASTYSNDGDLMGSTGGSAWMICINQNGDIIWNNRYGDSSAGLASIAQLEDGKFIAIGNNGSNFSNAGDVWVVSFSPTTGVKSPFSEQIELKIAPNPATNYFELRSAETLDYCMVSISAMLGPVLLQQRLDASHRIDASSLPPGFYMLQLECHGKSGRSVLIKI
ncbi:MAG: T9SS type A sorting domain-containing protein [Phycisphaerae bacterium]|nr:T9SS type A sorting domain-containing protein [Saprospiraceae bacterium]